MSNLSNVQHIDYALKMKQQIYNSPIEIQQKIFKDLMKNLANTIIGKEHGITAETKYTDFVQNLPIRKYTDFSKYLDLILNDQNNVLWPGKPLFLGTTSATTGVRKYIPVTKESVAGFIDMTLRMVLHYMYDENDYTILNNNIINFTGSTAFKKYNNFEIGSISSICRKMLPPHLADTALPSEQALNKMTSDGWEAMFKLTAYEALDKPVTICTGLPSWMAHFFKVCCDEYNIQNLTKLFPHLRLLCTSGVNYRPYLSQFQNIFDHKLNIREMYAATEGAFAYQDSSEHNSMLLNLHGGVFFEFIDAEQAHLQNSTRINLADVKTNKAYVPIISTNAGLWAYKMSDIVQFTSIKPYKISILGRTTHFISIVAEHVYAQVIENVVHHISKELNFGIINFTVAPSLISNNSKPYYDWYIETTELNNIDNRLLSLKIDFYLKQFSSGYLNSRNAGLLAEPKIKFLKAGAFMNYLQQKDQSSLQLKVPKLQNDRNIVDFLIKNDFVIKYEKLVV
jgi:hypothetical protein